ncbi:hypothetical protein [Brevibacterium sediminis]|uniref:Uncharacterized protein n=1 Tax=Brevibacterium sediminis TaxID=1857024 RepID=A0A5C4X141_9MICO|nr:hypothetical protein [Brevibacterium sediminis]TNM54450.1 hypothetical protein FHQ09_11380 [Brevibacterium sediminis]
MVTGSDKEAAAEHPTDAESSAETEVNATGTTNETDDAADERRIIGDAVALGFLVGRAMAAVVGMLLIASGLWFAGLLLIFVTNLDLPRAAAQRHLRKHRAELEIPSLKEFEATTLSGMLSGAGLIIAVCALAITQALLGHPILNWSWRAFTDGVDLFILVPLVGFALFIIINWFIRWRKRSSGEVTR